MIRDPFDVDVRYDSSTRIPRNSLGRAQISATVDRDLRLRRLVIENIASDWLVVDIQVNFTSRLNGKRAISGERFDSDDDPMNSLDRFLDNAVIRKGSQLSLIVAYIGPNASGARFRGVVIGTDLTPRA